VLIVVIELVLGLALIGAAIVWGLRFDRLSLGGESAVLIVTAVSAFLGAH